MHLTLHHVSNSSGVVDGASAVLLASPEYAKFHRIRPPARIRAMATVGGSPELVFDAPVEAVRNVLRFAGMDMKDIELREVNEAFPVAPIKFMRHLDIRQGQCKRRHCAGTPDGAIGAIFAGTLLDEMESRNLSVGMVAKCTAGGMASAMIVERF